MLPIIMPGNTKLGDGVFATSLRAGATCPGASSWCEVACYAKKGRYRFASVIKGLDARTFTAQTDLPAYEAQLREELARLPDGSTIRGHASGDFFSRDYVMMWSRVARDFPKLNFYFYTRSWNVPGLRGLLEGFNRLPNVNVWASTDETMPAAPKRWNEARLFHTADEAKSEGFTVCPEQTGKRASCSDCGLCWRVKGTTFKLAFIEH